jgi:hypothetical protein
MMLEQKLEKKHLDFLQLTTESGSPYHPFVGALRRMLGLHELTGDSKGKIVEPSRADLDVVLHHHLHEDEQGPIYEPRVKAIEALLAVLDAPVPAKSEPEKDDKPTKPVKEEKPAK